MTGLAPDVPLDKVEWRVQGTPAGGSVAVVAYLDAPTVARLLDEWVGPFGWSDRYEPVGKEGTLWCHLSVKDDDGQWVTKQDLGTASSMEADKGLVSDAFKRVAMRKWGVGRNVFDLPVLRINKFRVYQRGGKDQAALTGESEIEIRQRLAALGFEDAAQRTQVAASDEGPVEVDLAELEAVIINAQDAGLEKDWSVVREFASRSDGHRDKAVERLLADIAAAEGDDGG